MDEALAMLDDGSVALCDQPIFGLSDAAVVDAFGALQTVIGRLSTVQAALVREADGRGIVRRTGASSAAMWLRQRWRMSIGEAVRLIRLGSVLDQHPGVASCVLAGTVTPEQATTIGRALDELPAESPPGVRDKAAALLIEQSARFEPLLLRKLGERVLVSIAPDLAHEMLSRRLDHDERLARRDRSLSLAADGTGRTHIRGIIDAEGAAMLRAALEPLMRPLPAGPSALAAGQVAGQDRRSPAARRMDALVEICRLALRTGELPVDGGQPPQLNVTVDVDVLASGVGRGVPDTGEMLSAGVLRRLACDARVIPIVLGGASVPIDVGRARRLFAGASRTAVLLRDGGCAFPGCDRPPRWCDVHHLIAWVDGGHTDRDNGVALCAHHHRLVHHDGWAVVMGADRRPEFIPPPGIDASRTPRRNLYHPRI